MLDLRITFNDGTSVDSKGWADRPIQSLFGVLHAAFDDIHDVEITRYTYA